jgi:hypothetical protein
VTFSAAEQLTLRPSPMSALAVGAALDPRPALAKPPSLNRRSGQQTASQYELSFPLRITKGFATLANSRKDTEFESPTVSILKRLPMASPLHSRTPEASANKTSETLRGTSMTAIYRTIARIFVQRTTFSGTRGGRVGFRTTAPQPDVFAAS